MCACHFGNELLRRTLWSPDHSVIPDKLNQSCSDGVMQNLRGCQHYKLRQASFWILFFAISQFVFLQSKLNIPKRYLHMWPTLYPASFNSLGGTFVVFTHSNPCWTLDRLCHMYPWQQMCHRRRLLVSTNMETLLCHYVNAFTLVVMPENDETQSGVSVRHVITQQHRGRRG